MEALFTWPWLSLARGVASGPNTGATPPPLPPPPPPPEPFSASESVVPLLVAPGGVRLETGESQSVVSFRNKVAVRRLASPGRLLTPRFYIFCPREPREKERESEARIEC